MYIVWWILTIISLLVGIVGIVGIFNPDLLNKDLKKGTEPWTRKQASWTFVVCLILVVLFSSLAIEHLKTSSKQVTNKADDIVKKVASKEKAVQKKKTSNNTSRVSDQYLEDFLTYMDLFHTNLLQEIKNPIGTKTDVIKIITNGNVEGWKRYDKVNTTPSKESETQFDKRYDVLMAWQSLYDLDMDYNSYLMQDGNVELKTINQKETQFSQDFKKAKSDFVYKSN